MKWLLGLLVAFAVTAAAADISGNWKATSDGTYGGMERTFVFKVDGTKLTGETTSSVVGKSTINDGKVEGDTVTFTIVINLEGNEMKLTYKGKVSKDGKEIKFTVEGLGQPLEWLAKRDS